MMPPTPVDPLAGPKLALSGRIVTMDPSLTVVDKGTLYVDGGRIVAISRENENAPAGFEAVEAIKTQGTIYPGLIELHNHLSYNVLALMKVARKYANRDEWSGNEAYRKSISGPMNVLGKTPDFVEAVVRYVECKCLLGGVTTSQGVALYSNQGITRYYRGIVRNVEQTEDADLPEANGRIADVEATDAAKFLARLKRSKCLLLHLSEGTNSKAHEHFEALRLSEDDWAITPALSGIHCVALNAADFATLQKRGASMIWSPLSNLILYGATADIKAAKENGVRIGIGSDWSPSGSKNLFGELKVARLYSAENDNILSDREILAMATREAATILGWDHALGSLESGKRADVFVLNGRDGDPYSTLLEASEDAIRLVMINGIARYGFPSLMKKLGSISEEISVGGKQRALNLIQDTADPVVGPLTLSQARNRLQDGLHRLPELAALLEKPETKMRAMGLIDDQPRWFLALDHVEPVGAALRPHLPDSRGHPTGVLPVSKAPSKPLSQLLEPLDLDPLTVADDPAYLERIGSAEYEPNLLEYLRKGLPDLY